MKCPKCGSELAAASRHGVDVQMCPSCKGMWLNRQELTQLEDEVFFFGEHGKGTLVADTVATTHPCPACNQNLTQFSYRFNDLELELCGQGHGFWLDADEDTRILYIMKKEQVETANALRAEEKWGETLTQMRSGSFLDKLRDLLR